MKKTMVTLNLIEAIEMADLAKQGIQEADYQLGICSQELNSPIPSNETEDIIAMMMEIVHHRETCKKSLEIINGFIKNNKFILN